MKTRIKPYLLLAAMLFCGFGALPAHADGGETGGGGSGCLAEVMTAGYSVSQWLGQHGNTLTPAVSKADFLEAIDSNNIKFTTDDLVYQGRPADAYYNGQAILIRCDRFKNNPTDAQSRLLAHEVFRSMKNQGRPLEGDNYEISRQIWPDFYPSSGRPAVFHVNDHVIGIDWGFGAYGKYGTVKGVFPNGKVEVLYGSMAPECPAVLMQEDPADLARTQGESQGFHAGDKAYTEENKEVSIGGIYQNGDVVTVNGGYSLCGGWSMLRVNPATLAHLDSKSSR